VVSWRVKLSGASRVVICRVRARALAIVFVDVGLLFKEGTTRETFRWRRNDRFAKR
jgi:hypothetical protein